MAQGFSQRHVIDYEETHSSVMDATTFRYLIYLAVSEGLDMRLMDVVTTYLYGSIDTNVYIKIPERFKLPEVMNSKPTEHVFNQVTTIFIWIKTVWSNVV